jgi:predicted PurR-regulated permease PerM
VTTADRNRLVTRAVVTSLLGIIVVYTLYLIAEVLIAVYVSSLLAIGISPAVRKLERSRILIGRRFIPRWFAILLLYLGFLVAIAGVMAVVLPPMIEQGQQLAANLPTYIENLQGWLRERGLIQGDMSIASFMPSAQTSGLAITGVLGALNTALGILGTLLTVLLLPFYLLLESEKLHSWLLKLVKPQNRTRADRIVRAVTEKVAAWLGGQMLLALIIGSTATLGYWLMGVPYFTVLGLIAAVGELIPVIGPILACIPAIILGWTVSPQTALIVVIYTTAQQVIENNILVPRIMERQVGVSAVTIIIAMLVGTVLFGFVGAILAVPTAGIIQIMIGEHYKQVAEDHFRREQEEQESNSR